MQTLWSNVKLIYYSVLSAKTEKKIGREKKKSMNKEHFWNMFDLRHIIQQLLEFTAFIELYASLKTRTDKI